MCIIVTAVISDMTEFNKYLDQLQAGTVQCQRKVV